MAKLEMTAPDPPKQNLHEAMTDPCKQQFLQPLLCTGSVCLSMPPPSHSETILGKVVSAIAMTLKMSMLGLGAIPTGTLPSPA